MPHLCWYLSVRGSYFYWNKNAACGVDLYFVCFVGPLAQEKPPVIVFRRGLVAEGSDLETALLTSAKRWKQKGNRAEKCYSWAVTYLSLIHTHGHTHTLIAVSKTKLTECLRLLSQLQTRFQTHTNACGHPVVRSWYFFHILVKFTVDATSSSLLVHLQVIALDFFTATVTLSVYLEMLLNSRSSCLSPTGL